MDHAVPRTAYLRTEEIPLDRLEPFPGNAKQGRVDRIRESVREHGQYRSLVVRQTPEGALVVLAGNHTLRALGEEGAEAARCEVIECDAATARKINLVDNKSSDDGDYDQDALSLLLESLEGDLAGTGYDAHDYDSIITALAEPGWAEEQSRESLQAIDKLAEEASDPLRSRVIQRSVPLDAIYSSYGFASISLAAYEMGWLPGILSTQVAAARKLIERFPRYKISFMDNEWHGYDHAKHVAAVSEIHPTYATVRDAMTRQQCEAAGVEFIPLTRVLEMAEEMEQHADHVIVIPKYDCLDKIPEKYILGFSVPSSYGGTPMPVEMLRGRRVHLLGGSWARQRRCLSILGDDVVSFDNNNILKIAMYGHFVYGDGRTGVLSELVPGISRAWQTTVALSLANIRAELNRMYPLDEAYVPEIDHNRDAEDVT